MVYENIYIWLSEQINFETLSKLYMYKNIVCCVTTRYTNTRSVFPKSFGDFLIEYANMFQHNIQKKILQIIDTVILL